MREFEDHKGGSRGLLISIWIDLFCMFYIEKMQLGRLTGMSVSSIDVVIGYTCW